jgi:hypothetical protein
MRNKATVVWGLRFGLVVLVIWCEVSVVAGRRSCA